MTNYFAIVSDISLGREVCTAYTFWNFLTFCSGILWFSILALYLASIRNFLTFCSGILWFSILALYLASILTFCSAVPCVVHFWHLFWHSGLALAVEVRQCPLRSGARSWGPAMHSRLRSGSAHWHLELAVEVWQCLLISGARGWGRGVGESNSDRI